MSAIPFLLLCIWAIKNRKTLKDKFNLIFRRKKVVKINFRTATGFIIERYIIPNERGIANIDKGSYFINRDLCDFNAKYRIPEITFIETQPSVAVPELMVQEIETDVLIPTSDGSVVTQKKKVPNYVLSTRRLTPKQVEKLTAQEIRTALDSKIIRDIVNATNPQMQKLDIMFWCVVATIPILLIGLYIIHNDIKSVQNDMGTLARFLINSKGGT